MKQSKKITNEDILKYEAMVESFIKKYVVKNFNEASTAKNKGDVYLGNTGMCINDIRQYLRCEVVVALGAYDSKHITNEGKSVKESTFVFTHLFHRIGGMMKKITKKRFGYGIWMQNVDEVFHELEKD